MSTGGTITARIQDAPDEVLDPGSRKACRREATPGSLYLLALLDSANIVELDALRFEMWTSYVLTDKALNERVKSGKAPLLEVYCG